MKYLVVIEKTKNGFSAYSPDISGCIASGKTRKITEKRMKEAIQFHLEGLKEQGEKKPKPTAHSAYLEVAA